MATPENPYLNERFAQSESKRFARIEGGLTNRIGTLIKKGVRQPAMGVNLSEKKGFIAVEDDQRHLLEDSKRGTGTIWYKDMVNPYDECEDPLEIPLQAVREVLGVQTNRLLTISLHTDLQTTYQLDKLVQSFFVSPLFLMTTYYFDERGHHAKVSYLPLEIEDDRPVLKLIEEPTVGGKFVQSQMQANDFLVAGIALKSLTDTLKSSG